MTSGEPPRFQVGQEVLVDEGLPGEIIAVKRGTVPGVLDLPPRETWLYAADLGDPGATSAAAGRQAARRNRRQRC